VGCRVFGAQALWALGYPDQARQWSAEALAWAEALAHPFNMVFVLTGAARLHRFLREPHQVRARADAAIVLAQEQGFAQFLVQASIQRGGALAEQGQVAEGLAQIRQGLTAWQATGSYTRPHKLALLASVYGQVGQPEEGLRTLTEALTLVEAIGERFIEAELHRLTGALLLARSAETPADAETCFQQALAIARQQQAKSWELRAAMSLSRLWQQQGKRIEAHELLAPIYGWFTEGFDTADLQEAKALLEELGG
jgi:predicted ATPase